ncbi:hypothetical protein SPIROBIBN47_290030 [uncultured spirochete]|jgi:hypothetical protein|uniref:Transposase DDE domain-containing protein n=1 Tax=uncultured spirochete TaxID=156406 RepID=A0A3P3XJ06_9SPIR|nr:hypothetical protein SPIROBIBN47_290030 [uncultured spirochete]
MYRKKEKVAEFEKFDMVFGGSLRRANRWARLTDLIPWDEVEACYASLFVEQNSRPAISVRVALGSLILKENLQYCKARGIRLSGPKLGRPLSDIAKNQKQLREEQRIARQDERMRNAVEGKRRYSLDRIMTRLQATSESTIMMVFLVMNLGRLLRKTASAFFALLVSLISRLLRAQHIVSNHAAQAA